MTSFSDILGIQDTKCQEVNSAASGHGEGNTPDAISNRAHFESMGLSRREGLAESATEARMATLRQGTPFLRAASSSFPAVLGRYKDFLARTFLDTNFSQKVLLW